MMICVKSKKDLSPLSKGTNVIRFNVNLVINKTLECNPSIREGNPQRNPLYLPI